MQDIWLQLTLGFVDSRQDVNEKNCQTNIQEYNHADHNCVWPLREKVFTAVSVYCAKKNNQMMVL